QRRERAGVRDQVAQARSPQVGRLRAEGPADLPERAPRSVRPARRFEPAPPDVKGATVLVVDDERAWRAILETDLRLLGYEVVTAADAGEALERASSERPALAIVDLMLPEPVDGRELVRRLRARGDQVPVVFYSARGSLLKKADGP